MSDQLFHSRVNDVIPWQAKYPFPSQATKIHKQTTKFPPKNGGTFGSPGNGKVIRIEFPNDSYLNMLNSTLLFDLRVNASIAGTYKKSSVGTLTVAAGVSTLSADAQDQAILADIEHYWRGGYIEILNNTTGNPNKRQGKVYQIKEYTLATGVLKLSDATLEEGAYNVMVHQGIRFQNGGVHEIIKHIRIMYGGLVLEEIRDYNGLARILVDAGTTPGFKSSSGRLLGGTSQGAFRTEQSSNDAIVTSDYEQAIRGQLEMLSDTHRYAIQPFSGLLSCKKLIPLKWMAAQFVMEITLADAADCLIASSCVPMASASSLFYEVTNVNYLAELMDFDSTFDTAFFMGLKTNGVPLKFSSWHTHSFNITGQTLTAQIMERARSVKSAFARIKDTTVSLYTDTNRGYFDINVAPTDPTGTQVAGVQIRPGGSACPVKQFQFRIGGKYYPAQPVDCDYGATEAYVEFLKTMDAIGDYTFWNDMSANQWYGAYAFTGGDKFTIATEFEHADVFPDTISGLNAEEQSDMALMVTWNGDGSVSKKVLQIYVAYDALIVVRDGNVVNLIM